MKNYLFLFLLLIFNFANAEKNYSNNEISIKNTPICQIHVDQPVCHYKEKIYYPRKLPKGFSNMPFCLADTICVEDSYSELKINDYVEIENIFTQDMEYHREWEKKLTVIMTDVVLIKSNSHQNGESNHLFMKNDGKWKLNKVNVSFY